MFSVIVLLLSFSQGTEIEKSRDKRIVIVEILVCHWIVFDKRFLHVYLIKLFRQMSRRGVSLLVPPGCHNLMSLLDLAFTKWRECTLSPRFSHFYHYYTGKGTSVKAMPKNFWSSKHFFFFSSNGITDHYWKTILKYRGSNMSFDNARQSCLKDYLMSRTLIASRCVIMRWGIRRF